MAYSGNKGLKRIIKAAGFSWQGIKAAFEHEAAFRQEVALAVVLVPLAVWLSQTATQMALMISSIFIVMLVEIINSAIEAAIDRHGEEQHVLSGRAKDMGSAAVMFAFIYLLMIWGGILWDNFYIAL